MHKIIKNSKAWVVAADMGYGHQRAVYPLKDIAEDGIITAGTTEASEQEKKLWKRVLNAYEFFSRAKGIPVVGDPLFSLFDSMMHIPSSYPIRNLSNTTFQVNLLESTINKGLCRGVLEKTSSKELPLITSFYAVSVAADMKTAKRVFCIICDADINRAWVAKHPWESRIEYFAPCGRAAQRLKAYGVPEDKIHLTGFPLSKELIGDENLSTLKKDLAQRLYYLDPSGKFWTRHGSSVKHFLGEENCVFNNSRKLTITYAVGGAGAQKEIGGKIAQSLKNKIFNDEVRLNLVAGIRADVNEYFKQVQSEISDKINVIYSDSLYDYFDKFNEVMRTTDILWTKPSELSFYCALGIPIIMSPVIGSQEKFNRKWLREIKAGIKQDNPEYTDQWLYDLLNRGTLAECAWDGFLKARKLGTYKILEVLESGSLQKETSPVFR